MNSTALQPIGVCVFLAAFVLIAAGLALDNNVVLLVLGILTLVGSIAVFKKAKASYAEE